MKEGEITPGITSEEYISRRQKLLDLLPADSLAIIAAAPVKMMTDVVPYTFRQDANYLYITGCQQPGGVAVLGHECGFCMFMPEATPQVCLVLYGIIFFDFTAFLSVHMIYAIMSLQYGRFLKLLDLCNQFNIQTPPTF